MGYIYEKVTYNENLPAKILMQDKPGRRCNTSLHWHKEIELVYMIKGCLHIRTNGLESTIEDGEFYICNSEEIHITYVDNMSANYTYLVLLLSYDELKKYCIELDQYSFQVNREELAYEQVRQQILELVSLCRSKDPYVAIEEKVCLLKIYHILLSSCAVPKEQHTPVKKIKNTMHAKEIIQYISEHYKEKITLQDAAKVAGFSAQYFSKYFRKLTEMGFVQYLQYVRAEHGIQDMLNRDLTVTDTAYENGFTNVKSFITTCKRIYGLTPTQYKKEMKRKRVCNH
ncbi:AraC family transcriptional regulator [Anaerosporobacter faecicola]|uniref:AraC family transcriptional regulator n=1 Tax=Anaerosporobacter faecicola TaxID=2718714 RepID=UPI001439B207|nr:AraC family transcriptional regulator [Anaerosporobacter faecicola]